MDFEEYVSANYKRLEGQTRELVEDAFKAGQQSKQAEIDALKKTISEALDWLDASHSKQDDAIKRAKSKLRGIK